MRPQEADEFLRLSGSRPDVFQGAIRLPPSKSYLHRALFVSSLCSTRSRIEDCGSTLSEDVRATINALKSFGVMIHKERKDSDTSLIVHPGAISSSGEEQEIFAGGSGTTARFAIAFAAVPADGGHSTITGDASLLKRPMQPLIDGLSQIGVNCYSRNSDGRLPVVVEANGIEGGRCGIDGSVSSQFISALLIACTRARKDTTIEIENPTEAVSVPYIKATLFVLNQYGFGIKMKKTGGSLSFRVRSNQDHRKGRKFSIPGDMSSGAALIGATLAAKGRIRLIGFDPGIPQADAVFLNVARKFGATVSQNHGSIIISALGERNDYPDRQKFLTFDLKDSPDVAPIVAGVAAALGRNTKIRNVAHLHFKESDRLSALAMDLSKMGLRVAEDIDSISISPPHSIRAERMNGERKKNKPTILNSENDHRILMAMTVAGISGRFGELLISEPSCVRKSYPSFISDLNSLIHDQKKTLSIVKRRRRKEEEK